MSDDLQNTANQAAESVENAVQDAAGAVQDAADAVQDAESTASDAARDASSSASTSAKSTADQVVEGFGKAGAQVKDSAQKFWESDQRKDVQESVAKGVSSVTAVIEEQMKRLAENPDTKKVVTKVETVTGKVVEDVSANKAIQDLAEIVMKLLNTGAASIEHWLDQQRTSPATPAAPSAPKAEPDDTQTIDIQRDVEI